MGTLTGLCRAVYIDQNGKGIKKSIFYPIEVTVDDQETGLYIKKKSGVVVKINIPEDGLMLQVKESFF